ncbi:MAG TPA: M3 family metallopeptidase [Caldimonas sp.]|nr:M3 family metallopeptidase [Caldimonas sp.]
MNNPLLAPWSAPFGLPPFAATRPEHFAPALTEAMARHLGEVEAISGAAEAPTFANTIAALDRSGRDRERIESLFWNLTSSETSPALQEVQREVVPQLAAHESRVRTHAGLFARIDALHARRDALGLDDEQRRVLERFHLDAVRAGARLAPDAQARHAEIVQRIAELMTRFGQNLLADESAFKLVLRSEADFAGLPEFVRAAARQAALDRGVADGAVITLSRSLIVPFLTFSERRDLREAAWRAWTSRGEHAGATDNRAVAAEILQLRLEQARLHGFASFADYTLSDTMAQNRDAVRALLDRVWQPALARAEEEREALAAIALSRGECATIEPWDWRFYAEKVRRVRFDLDDAEIKPYFPLEAMIAAAFDCATRLFGISFVERRDLVAYHPDVRVYEVHGASGPIGVFLHDNFARPTKRSGAWMSEYRTQSRNGGAPVLPIVVNNNNFAKAAPGEPTLLSFDDARTLFHEFGHGLHGLLSNVRYERLASTNVLRDFVELPSQLFEHWLDEPEVLKRHARHHRTGEPIPDALIAKLRRARHFNQGYETLRYTASAMVDMAIHARTSSEPVDIVEFERAELARIGLPHGVGVNHRLVHFQHLFSGGYAAGYYVYLWAEVLDADGYDAFVEAGDPFDPAVARRVARFIYSAGNSIEPGAAYRAFRGRDAIAEPMLRERGLLETVAT